MKERILSNWTLRRGLFLAFGIYLIVMAIVDHQWFGVLFGSYFASMGLFSFGCASGNCQSGSCDIKPNQKSTKTEPS